MNNNIAKFGVAGIPINFKGKFEIFFDWLNLLGLNAYEIQCTYGFKIADSNIAIINQQAISKGIYVSMHAPYFINMGSLRFEVAMKSKEDMKSGILLAQKVGCKRIIFHPGGGYGKTENERKEGIQRIADYCNQIDSEIDAKDVKLYPEIAGKTSNLGSLDEIIYLCQNCNICYPCIDIAHLHARENGGLKTKNDIKKVLQKLKDNLPIEKFENLHFHAYTIMFGEKGEIKHLQHCDKYEDGREGEPNLTDFIEVLKEFNLTPWIISEASNTQELGAKFMKDYYKG